MTPEIKAAFQKYRYENLLPRAIEQQKRNDKIRRFCGWMLAVCGVYIVLAAIISSYLEKKYGIQFQDTWREIALVLPPSVVSAIGLMGIILYKGNSVMELTKVGDTYFPKNS